MFKWFLKNKGRINKGRINKKNNYVFIYFIPMRLCFLKRFHNYHHNYLGHASEYL